MPTVTLDSLTVEAAYVTDVRWNGFACPYFTRTQADLLAEMINAESIGNPDAVVIEWDAPSSGYRIIDPAYPADDQLVLGVMVDGHPEPLYPIGAWSWTWSLA